MWTQRRINLMISLGLKYQRIHRTSLKTRCLELKGGKCERCGYNKSHRALHFHHRDPSLKLYSIAEMIRSSSWEAIKEELEKCDLLCANCHYEEEEKKSKGGLVQINKIIQKEVEESVIHKNRMADGLKEAERLIESCCSAD
jgi:hypothetical protein